MAALIARLGLLALLVLPAAAPATLVAARPLTDPLVDADGAAAYLVQVDGRIVGSRAATLRRQPASLAKLALALLVLERNPAGIAGGPLQVFAEAASAPPSRLGLRAGDRVERGDLLAATLVASANDACLALAQDLGGGSATRTVAAMNRLAARLSMLDTRFVDPCGFDQPGQYTTAADLLKLANAALANPTITGLASQRAVTMTVTGASGLSRTLVASTSNALLERAEGVTGLKTGYTRLAGRSLIAVAELDANRVVVVVLGSRDRFHAALRLIEYGFSRAGPARDGLPVPVNGAGGPTQ